MNAELRRVRRWARVALVSAMLVVLAGAVVRTTGSGMGCPDWPKCFGLAIPPTRLEQVEWSSSTAYNAGRMVLVADTLWVAEVDHTSGTTGFASEREAGRWSAYTVHDYTHFAPHHTWIEFINRLLGAWTGIPALVLCAVTALLGFRHGLWRPGVAAVVGLVLLGYVAWLGKLVVDGNLVPFSITKHMLGAVAIVMAFAAAIAAATPPALNEPVAVLRKARKRWQVVVGLAWAIAVAQLVFGTQVREAVDAVAATGLQRGQWLEALPSWWKGHRSAAWAVALVHAAWLGPVFRAPEFRWRSVPAAVAGVLVAQFATGIAFAYADMPAWSQPVHLLLGVLLVVLDLWVLLRLRAAVQPLRVTG